MRGEQEYNGEPISMEERQNLAIKLQKICKDNGVDVKNVQFYADENDAGRFGAGEIIVRSNPDENLSKLNRNAGKSVTTSKGDYNFDLITPDLFDDLEDIVDTVREHSQRTKNK